MLTILYVYYAIRTIQNRNTGAFRIVEVWSVVINFDEIIQTFITFTTHWIHDS